MRSMTGFGEAARETARYRLSVTLRSVNHRYLDLSLRLPEAAAAAEGRVRELLGESLERGRVEVRVEGKPLGGVPEVGVDPQVVEAFLRACRRLEPLGVAPGLAARDLLALPGAVVLESGLSEWGEEETEALLGALAEALEQLVAARSGEGERLAAALRERLEGLETVAAELRRRRPEALEALVDSLGQRLERLLAETGLPEERLAQEAALLAERSDVSEELDRLDAHLERMEELLGADGALGRPLDFLVQEISRELNTLAAKCRDLPMVGTVLEGKGLCEQLREQVRNVE